MFRTVLHAVSWLVGEWKYVGGDCIAEEHVCVWTYTCTEQTAIRQEPRPCTSNPRHPLHRLFPACRVIPAPALPPLPLHTYQSPTAVPLPESGSSSLENLEEQQQPVLLALFILSLSLSLSLTISLPFHCYSVNWKIHLTSFPSNNELLICDFLCFIFKVHMHETSTLGCFCLSALPGSNNIPETSWVDPAPLPFHNFLLSHPLMGQIFYFWYIRFVAVINFHKNSCKNVATLKFSTATTILLQYIFSFDIFLVLQIHFLPLFFSTWRKQPNDCSQKCDETTDRWVDLANPLSLCGAAVEVLKWRIL